MNKFILVVRANYYIIVEFHVEMNFFDYLEGKGLEANKIRFLPSQYLHENRSKILEIG